MLPNVSIQTLEDDIPKNVVNFRDIKKGADAAPAQEAGEFDIIENPDGSAEIVPIGTDFKGPVNNEGDFDANLAEGMSDTRRKAIVSDLIELIEQDKKTRERRDKLYAEGLRRSGLGNDAPGGADFEGASTVVHPVLAEACVDFEARAIKELFPPSGPVKTSLLGENRSSVERTKVAERKKSTLNWLLTKGSPEYKAELEQTLSQVPLGGSQFMKVVPDFKRNKLTFEFVPIDDLFIAYSASSIYNSQRTTHRQWVSRLKFNRRVEDGLYLDVAKIEYDDPQIESSQAAEANRKIEGIELDYYNDDGLREVYECRVMYELEEGEDSLAEDEVCSYIMHIDKESEELLGVYRNWEEEDPYKTPLDWLVEYGLIPWRGAYKLGLPHLIGSLSGAATGALRALLDAAHIANSQTLIKLSGGRMVGQNTDISPTQIAEVQGPAGVDDIRKIIMPLQFPGPNATLFQLLGFLVDAAKGVVTTAEEKISDASNQMPVGTTLALIEQGSKVFASIHARMHESQAKMLEIVCRLLRMYPELLERAQKVLGEECADPDVFQSTDDISPVSDPNIFSEAQRFAQVQAVMQLSTSDPQVQYKKLPLHRRILALMNFPDADEILPPEKTPITADPVNENAQAILENNPLKASMQQDHLSHLREHLRFICDPLQGANPVIPVQGLQIIFQHCSEHLIMMYQAHVTMAGSDVAAHMLSQRHSPSSDALSAAAAHAAVGAYQAKIAPMLGEMFQQAQKIIQSKTQPQPMDPTQATLMAAKAETERRAAKDAQDMQLAQAKMAADAQEKQAKLASDMQKFMATAQKDAEDARTTLMAMAEDLRLQQTKQDNDNAIELEKLQQGWAELEQKAAEMGIQRDQAIQQMLDKMQEGVNDHAPVLEEFGKMREDLRQMLKAHALETDDKLQKVREEHLKEREKALKDKKSQSSKD